MGLPRDDEARRAAQGAEAEELEAQDAPPGPVPLRGRQRGAFASQRPGIGGWRWRYAGSDRWGSPKCPGFSTTERPNRHRGSLPTSPPGARDPERYRAARSTVVASDREFLRSERSRP